MATAVPSSRIDASELTTDVLIVGSGPLGLTASIGLTRAGVDHIVAESGDVEPGAAQEFCDGVIAGGRYPDLIKTRIRALGGTSHVWGGHSSPLRPIDFGPRPWLGLKGWPIAYEDFRPWFSRVAPLFRVRDTWAIEDIEDAPDWLTALELPHFSVETYRLSPTGLPGIEGRVNFWNLNGDQVGGRVITDLTARALEFDGTGTINRVRFTAPGGREIHIAAKRVVLALGGIETARFLLIQRASGQAGPLAALSHIGLGFMEHPHTDSAHVFLFERAPWQIHSDGQSDGTAAHTGFFLRDPIQKALGLPSLYFRLRRPGDEDYRRGTTVVRSLLLILSEQIPDDSRRVALSNKRYDSLGEPLAELTYRVNHVDVDAIVRATELAARDLAMAGFGRAQLRLTRPDRDTPIDDLPHIGVGHHHMGTVRMGLSAADGVVDADLKVFGTTNLYLATTGIFPTSSCVNPTMSGAAFALRLADHLATLRS